MASDPQDTPPQDTPQLFRSPELNLSRGELRVVVTTLMLALFLSALDQTIVAPAMPTIGAAFGDFENLSWVISAYFLTYTAMAPVFGRLSDIFGRRVMLLWALGLFMAGSLACALAPNMIVLILARGLQGLGGGGLIPLSQTVISDLVAPKERGQFQTYFTITWVTACIGGPLLGGVFSEIIHWSMIFWINIPLGLIACALVITKLGKLPDNHMRRHVDVSGGLLLMASSILFVLAMTWGGVRYDWNSVLILGLLGATLLLALAFVVHALRIHEPFLPLPLLSGRVVPYALFASACCMGGLIGLSIILPIHFQLIYHLSPSLSGLALMPMVVLGVPGAFLASQLMMRTSRYKLVPIVFLLISAAAAFALFVFPALPLPVFLALSGVIGFGIGTQFPVSTVAAQNAVPPREVGTTTGAIAFFRGLAGAVVVAVFSAILLNGLGFSVTEGHGAEFLAKMNAVAAVTAARAFAYVYLAAGLLFLVAAVAFIVMEERALISSADGVSLD